jgi:hypothetical protein
MRSRSSPSSKRKAKTDGNAVLESAQRRIRLGLSMNFPVLLSIFLAANLAFCANLAAAQDSATAPAIVIGFLGGRVAHTNAIHSEVQLATRLRQDYPAGVQVRLFENRRGDQALREILQLLDANRDGVLSSEEKHGARITIYGHSWGASETVALSRTLGRQSIPVLLTVLVDSVRKPGENDEFIPANVAEAVNFYQRDGLLRGRAEIRADDPSRTRILGNFRFDYKTEPVNCEGYPWYARLFMKPHIEIESDPAVWQRVESLIRSKLPPATSTAE